MLLYETSLFSRSNTVTLTASPRDDAAVDIAERRTVAECDAGVGVNGGEITMMECP